MDRPWHAKLHTQRDITLYDVLHEYIGVALDKPRTPEPASDSMDLHYTRKAAELAQEIERVEKMTAGEIRNKARHELLPGVVNIQGPRDAEVLAEYKLVISVLKPVAKRQTPLTSSIHYQLVSLESTVALLSACVPEALFDVEAWRQAKLSVLGDSLESARRDAERERLRIEETQEWYAKTTAAIPNKVVRPKGER